VVERGGVEPLRPPWRLSSQLERQHVADEPHPAVRRAWPIQDGAQQVQGGVQAPRRGRGVRLRPERVAHPFAVDAIAGRAEQEREEGQHVAPGPAPRGDTLAAPPHREAAQRLHPQGGRRAGRWSGIVGQPALR